MNLGALRTEVYVKEPFQLTVLGAFRLSFLFKFPWGSGRQDLKYRF